jgi:hypothetical protein
MLASQNLPNHLNRFGVLAVLTFSFPFNFFESIITNSFGVALYTDRIRIGPNVGKESAAGSLKHPIHGSGKVKSVTGDLLLFSDTSGVSPAIAVEVSGAMKQISR